MSTVRTYRTRTQLYGRANHQTMATDPGASNRIVDSHEWISPRLLDVLSPEVEAEVDDGSWIAPATAALFHP